MALFTLYSALLPAPQFFAVPAVAAAESSDSATVGDDEPPSTLIAVTYEPRAIGVSFEVGAVSNLPMLSVVIAGSSRDDERRYQEEQAELARQQAAAEAERARQEALRAQQARYQIVQAAAVSSGHVQDLLRQATEQYFGAEHWPAMHALVMKESGFNPNAYNRNSGACGLFQALPCSKMGGMELNNQISWGIGYISRRYGTPTRAWDFWLRNRWY